MNYNNHKRANVELHNSWLALNSVVGCTNACKTDNRIER